MKEIKFEIIKWETSNKTYTLKVDDRVQLENIKIGDLRTILYEIEKYCRLRFKGELEHKKSSRQEKKR